MKHSILSAEVASQWPDLTPKLTKEQFFDLGFTQADLDKGERRLDLETRGPWSIVSRIRGMAVRCNSFADAEKNYRGEYTHSVDFLGFRSLDKPKNLGYEMEGKVSIDGKRIRAFTSSLLVKVDEKLVSIGILYV